MAFRDVKNRGGPFTGVYPAYLFVDHDPILDQIDTVIADAGLDLTAVAGKSHVSPTTLYNWSIRKTRRPQFASVAAVVRACGGEIIVQYRGKTIARPQT
jgi:hypothetical protein